MIEQWLPVVGYEGLYEISDSGRVRSHQRIPAILLRPSAHGKYLKVTLHRDGARELARIQWLVAAAFIGPRPLGMDVCHNNGKHRDNRVGNLRYDTRSANIKDAVRHGTHYAASKTHCPQGHEYTPENTRINSTSGGRMCRTCENDAARRRYRERTAVR